MRIRDSGAAAGLDALLDVGLAGVVEYSFSGEIWYWRGPSPFHFVSIPEPFSAEIKSEISTLSYGWGAIPVVCSSGSVEWATSIFPKDGVFIVPVKAAVRSALVVDVGDLLEMKVDVGS